MCMLLTIRDHMGVLLTIGDRVCVCVCVLTIDHCVSVLLLIV